MSYSTHLVERGGGVEGVDGHLHQGGEHQGSHGGQAREKYGIMMMLIMNKYFHSL